MIALATVSREEEEIGDGGLLMVPGRRFDLEGKPTQPDYPVKRKIAYSAGADPQIRLAKQILAGLIRQKRSNKPKTPEISAD